MPEKKIITLRGDEPPVSAEEIEREVHVLITALRHIAHRAGRAGFDMAATFAQLAAEAIVEDQEDRTKEKS